MTDSDQWMGDRWKYPFYVSGLVLLVLWLFGCDSRASGVPLEETVEHAKGRPVTDATVNARPSYERDGRVTCTTGDDANQRTRSGPKSVDLISWNLQANRPHAVFTGTTAREPTNVGFEIEEKVGGAS